MAALQQKVDALEASNAELRALVASLVRRVDALEGGSSGGQSNHSDAPRSIRVAATSQVRASSANPRRRGSDDANSLKQKLSSSAQANRTSIRGVVNPNTVSYNVGKKKLFVTLPDQWKPTEASEPPGKNAVLTWAYGFNGKSARDNLFITEEGELIYCLAGTGVVYNPAKQQQRFFVEHNEDIVSLSVHPTATLVATGQIDPKGSGTPFTCIWDYKSMQLVQKITFHERGVCAVSFSPDGKYLLTIGEDDSHTAAIWDWEKNPKKPVASLMIAKDEVFGCEWSPDAKDGQYAFVTFGAKHLKWHIVRGKNDGALEVASAIPASYDQTKIIQKAYHSAAWYKDGLVVGGFTGHVYVFNGNQKFVKFFESGTEPINAIITLADGGYIAVSTDGHLRYYDADHNLTKDVDTGKSKPVSVRRNKTTLALGCKNSDLFLAPINNPDERRLVQSGFTAEIWALATHPSQPIVAVGSDDKRLRLYNHETKETILVKTAKSGVRSLDFSPNGANLAVGSKDGTIMMFELSSGEFVYEKKLCKEQVDAIAFSPDGTKIAAGSWDQTIRIIDPFKSKELRVLKGHTSSITHLNFSVDGNYIMSASRDYEILYWDVEAGKRLVDPLDANTQWDRWNSVLGWPVQGVFCDAGDGTDVNCVAISGGNGIDDEGGTKIVATGDDMGHVNIFRYPVLAKKPKNVQCNGHSAHVTNVRFTRDSKYLFSTGGGDLATFQWTIVDN